jgi:hypothetical protein
MKVTPLIRVCGVSTHTLKSRVGPKWISEKFSFQKRTKAKLQVEKKWDFGKDFFLQQTW